MSKQTLKEIGPKFLKYKSESKLQQGTFDRIKSAQIECYEV